VRWAASAIGRCGSQRQVSNPNSLNFPHADVVVSPVVQTGGFGVRVPGHALRDLDAPAVR